MAEVLIIIEGGLIQLITATETMTIRVIDRDNVEVVEDVDDVYDIKEPDVIASPSQIQGLVDDELKNLGKELK